MICLPYLESTRVFEIQSRGSALQNSRELYGGHQRCCIEDTSSAVWRTPMFYVGHHYETFTTNRPPKKYWFLFKVDCLKGHKAYSPAVFDSRCLRHPQYHSVAVTVSSEFTFSLRKVHGWYPELTRNALSILWVNLLHGKSVEKLSAEGVKLSVCDDIIAPV